MFSAKPSSVVFSLRSYSRSNFQPTCVSSNGVQSRLYSYSPIRMANKNATRPFQKCSQHRNSVVYHLRFLFRMNGKAFRWRLDEFKNWSDFPVLTLIFSPISKNSVKCEWTVGICRVYLLSFFLIDIDHQHVADIPEKWVSQSATGFFSASSASSLHTTFCCSLISWFVLSFTQNANASTPPPPPIRLTHMSPGASYTFGTFALSPRGYSHSTHPFLPLFFLFTSCYG